MAPGGPGADGDVRAGRRPHGLRVVPAMTAEMGAALREMRKRNGMTLRDVAQGTGVHFTYLSKCENGAEEPGAKLITRLGSLYNEDMSHVGTLSGRSSTRLRAENTRLRELIREINAFAKAHHADQDPPVWLHGLIVDIPDMIEQAGLP